MATREHVPAPRHPHLLTDQRPCGVMVEVAAGELVLGGPPGGLASLVTGVQAGGAQGSSQDIHLRCGRKDSCEQGRCAGLPLRGRCYVFLKVVPPSFEPDHLHRAGSGAISSQP